MGVKFFNKFVLLFFTSDLEKKVLRKIITFSLSRSQENLYSRFPKNI